MAYLYLDFDYSIENNRLTEVDIKIETRSFCNMEKKFQKVQFAGYA